MQIIGRQFAEETVLQVGYNYEQANPLMDKKPTIK
jgi:Asp-tRNA(Asn)/Glu-tRNA(Gln) amidotransferase A subunit family amidase